MKPTQRVILKVDCHTIFGIRNGLPNLLSLFNKFRIRASFFFTFGPDNSGQLLLNHLIKPNGVSYDLKSFAFGTILPGPRIGRWLANDIRKVTEQGHEAGVLGWDYTRWIKKSKSMDKRGIEGMYSTAHSTFKKIFGFESAASAAPGWIVNPTLLWTQDTYGLLYSSNNLYGPPHFNLSGRHQYKTLEIPTTLPPWVFQFQIGGDQDLDKFFDLFNSSDALTNVHTINADIEGGLKISHFEKLLLFWKDQNVQFISLETYAKELLSNRDRIRVFNLDKNLFIYELDLAKASLRSQDVVNPE